MVNLSITNTSDFDGSRQEDGGLSVGSTQLKFELEEHSHAPPPLQTTKNPQTP